MNEQDLVLSDVHIHHGSKNDENDFSKYERYLSQFLIYQTDILNSYVKSPEGNDTPNTSDSFTMDEDGDFNIPTKKNSSLRDIKYVIRLEHTLSTTLVDVGLQVWRASLSLCDFIINNSNLFSGKKVLELGSGTGLVSIVAAIFSSMIFTTDRDCEILRQCSKNLSRHRHLYPDCSIYVRKLNWTQDLRSVKVDDSQATNETQFEINSQEMLLLKSCEVILASDVIYDNQSSDAFLKTVKHIMSEKPMILFIAIEQRLNFSIEDLETTCPAYNYFILQLNLLTEKTFPVSEEQSVIVTVEHVPATFPQFIEYTRDEKLMEILKIESKLI